MRSRPYSYGVLPFVGQTMQHGEHDPDEDADADSCQELEDDTEDISGIIPVVRVEPTAGAAPVAIATVDVYVSEDIDSSHNGSPSWPFGQSIEFG